MATQPGTPAAAMPAGEDALVRRVADIERALRELGPSIARSFSGTVADLTAAQADLATAQGTLSDTVAGLSTTQDDLADALTTLQGVVDAQVFPRVSSGTGSGFYVTSSFTTVASALVTVPAGYSRALVFASGHVLAGNSDAQDVSKLYAHVTVNGAAGNDSIVSMAGLLWNSAPAFGSASLTGLSGGNIVVTIAARLSSGTTGPGVVSWDNATVATQVLFLR